jgi:hypothetical protein
MDEAFERMLEATPTTIEGFRALAIAITHYCANDPEINEPESDLERGAVALLAALAA